MSYKKILVVDDSVAIRKILTNILKELAIPSIVVAKDGKDAIDKMDAEGDIDLILSDWNMPQISGLEFLKRVKKNEETKGIPFVMISSLSSKNDIMEAIENGAVNYIVKPFEKETVKQIIESLNGQV